MKNSQAPGPYTFDGFGINAGDEHKSRIATITPARFWPTSPEEAEESRIETANLLAASKDLYEALLFAQNLISTIDRQLSMTERVGYAKIRKALKKAEGEN